MDQQYQHWLYALSAPMVALNIEYGASYTAPDFYPNDSSLDLKESWDIESRESLFDTVTRMIDHGHADELSYPYYLWHQLTPNRWRDYSAHQEESRQVLLEFVADTALMCGSGGIRAWDLCRMSFLCRIGVLNQWITEQESLWFHCRIAQRARHYYASWQEYASGFLIGRTFWLSISEEQPELKRYALNSKGTLDSNMTISRHLFTEPNSPYQHLIWEMDPAELEMEKPQSLQEVDWS